MASGNQASDGKAAEAGGYQLGELAIGAPPKRPSAAEHEPVAAHSPSGVQPAGTAAAANQAALIAQQQQRAAAMQAQAARASHPTGQGGQMSAAAAQAQAQLAAQQRASHPTGQGGQMNAAAAQAQAQLAAQQRAALLAQQQRAAQLTGNTAQLSGAAAQAQAQLAAQQRAAQATAGNAQLSNAAAIAQAYAAKAQAAMASQPAATPKAAASAEKGLGRGNFDGADEAGPSLELDLDAVRAPKKGGVANDNKAGAPAAPAMDFSSFGTKDLGDGFGSSEDESPALELETVDKSGGGRVTTKGTVDPKEEARKEEERTRNLADFGDEPENLVECAKYAVHVVRRIMTLKQGRTKAEQEVKGLEVDHNTALVEMGQALMAMATDPKLQPLRSKVAAVHDAQAKVNSADVTMSKTREENQRAVKALEQEAEEVRTTLQPYMEAEQRADAAHKQAEEALKRAQGLVKRAEIELRAHVEGKGPDPEKEFALNAQLESRKQGAIQVQVQVDQAAQVLGAARRDLAMRRGTLDSIEDKKKRLLEEAKAREAEVEQKAKAAEGGHAAALRALAETCIEAGMQSLVEERFEWVKEVEGVLADARKVLQRYDRALVMYDRPSLMKGFGLLGGLTLLLILAISMAAC